MALGTVDYGLMGLVGGLIGFVVFLNSVLANANARFYAISIGAANVADDKLLALEECRRWFNTALFIHMVVPVALMLIGYPLGVYAIENWLTIPVERIAACVWVFRFSCISCFVAMVGVPFTAMYGAKQYIAELTIYSFVTTTLNVCMLYYMVMHPGDWLKRFACWTCVLAVLPQLIICIRAACIFPECRVRFSYMGDIERMKRVGVFSGWQFVGFVVNILKANGMMVVVNKFFGATMNAAQAVGTTVMAHCTTLSGAMQGAFNPVIIQSYGAGDYKKMNRFVLRSCRFNALLSVLFMIPLSLELPEVMRIWLKNPPAYSVGLCYCAMLLYLVSSFTMGHQISIDAVGRLAPYYKVAGPLGLLALPLAVAAGFLWHNVYIMMLVVVVIEATGSVWKLRFAGRFARASERAWFREVLVPLSLLTMSSMGIGYLPHLFMEQSLTRVCATVCVSEMAFVPVAWFFVLTNEERILVKDKVFSKIAKSLGAGKCE